jgi:hypothetical protein
MMVYRDETFYLIVGCTDYIDFVSLGRKETKEQSSEKWLECYVSSAAVSQERK